MFWSLKTSDRNFRRPAMHLLIHYGRDAVVVILIILRIPKECLNVK